ncbi:MAG TPA: cysteine desulfurase CsdA [Gammaproteobacteria bacterium]|nr:cysteine desulfurase CsdA [Gammaproteobacteria bacterium]
MTTGEPSLESRSETMRFDMDSVRADFPLIQGSDVVYLDNAATTQKPTIVLDALHTYYETYNANVHRAAHSLSDKATEAFERAREILAHRINARHAHEVIWTRGTTESINLVANCYAQSRLKEGDEVLISEMEHHSNIVPWQIACAQTGASLKAVRVQPDGVLDLDNFAALLSDATRIVAIAHVSNALGTINPIEHITSLAHSHDADVLIDGAQAAAHLNIDVQALGCDFYAFSGHKVYAPTGIGILYGKESLLDDMPPWQAGGEMIEEVRLEATTYQSLPYKFEAGTPNIAGAIGFGTAIEYVDGLDGDSITRHEKQLLDSATTGLEAIDGVRIVGTASDKGPVVSFLVDGSHPTDIGTLLDQQGVAVRAGHHCAMPLMEALEIPGTVRASFSLYNRLSDVDRLIETVEKARRFV